MDLSLEDVTSPPPKPYLITPVTVGHMLIAQLQIQAHTGSNTISGLRLVVAVKVKCCRFSHICAHDTLNEPSNLWKSVSRSERWNTLHRWLGWDVDFEAKDAGHFIPQNMIITGFKKKNDKKFNVYFVLNYLIIGKSAHSYCFNYEGNTYMMTSYQVISDLS